MNKRWAATSNLLWPTCCLLMLLIAGSARAESQVVVLPDDGVFSVWVRSEQGAVVIMPFTSKGHGTISLSVPSETGQTLFVLDAKTGRLASSPIHVEAAAPITLLVSDFQIVGPADASAALPEPQRSFTTSVGRPEADGSEESGAPRAVSDEEDWTAPLVTFLMGMALAGFSCWLFLKLMRRGSPANDYADVPVFAPETPIPQSSGASFSGGDRPRYRVAKSGGRRSHRRMRAHTPHLVGIAGVAAGSKFGLSTPVVSIGRDGDNEIVLAETKVSRRHARIEHEPSGSFMLVDEASANGVYVNGMRVEKAVLRQGDDIKIGESHFRYEE